MRLTLVSNHRNLEVRQHARFIYHCDGADHKPHPPSPQCEKRILKGDMYVAQVEWQQQHGRAVPLMKVDIGKFCVHCALSAFVDIKIDSRQEVARA